MNSGRYLYSVEKYRPKNFDQFTKIPPPVLSQGKQVEDSDSLSVSEISEVERGRLRCLIELGQLEAAIEQSKVAMQKLPQLEISVLPLGIEAAWRLS